MAVVSEASAILTCMVGVNGYVPSNLVPEFCMSASNTLLYRLIRLFVSVKMSFPSPFPVMIVVN
jgi:hypothetical protein